MIVRYPPEAARHFAERLPEWLYDRANPHALAAIDAQGIRDACMPQDEDHHRMFEPSHNVHVLDTLRFYACQVEGDEPQYRAGQWDDALRNLALAKSEGMAAAIRGLVPSS